MDSTTIFRDGDGGSDLRSLAVRTKKAAQLLGMSVSSLQRLYKAGEIPRFKHGGKVFYRVASLDAWLAKNEKFAQDGAA